MRPLSYCIQMLSWLFIALISTNHADEPLKTYPLGPELKDVPLEELEAAYPDKTGPEGIRMYMAIMRGSRMQPGDGWFGPAQSSISWKEISEKYSFDPKAGWGREQFTGTPEWFDRLDRNRNGFITEEDLDWSDRHPWVQSAGVINRLYRKADSSSDGQLTREEWIALFDSMAQDKQSLTRTQLKEGWLAGMSSSFDPSDEPSQEVLLKGLFAGEIGSLQEGPTVGEKAPDFTLKSADGQTTIHLADCLSSKPIVLCFGNFTCGPFRSTYADVDEIAVRHRESATFVGVYVREAHPTDGWSMKSNASAGVSVLQPKTMLERTSVAQQCFAKLKPTFPWLVDEIDDSVGHAYSGMPARLYVIDPSGNVVYKSGRGPFGFKPGEMEQALIWTLLQQRSASSGS